MTVGFLTLPTVLPEHYQPDLSLSALLDYAHSKGIRFGSELAYTYGPMGYLVFPCFSSYAPVQRLVADVVLCFVVALGLCLVARRLRPTGRVLLPAVFLFAATNIDPRTDLVLQTGLFCWGLLGFVESGKRLLLCIVMFIGLAVFAALAKTSFFLLTLVGVLILIGDLASRGQLPLAFGTAIGFTTAFLIGWKGCGQLLGDLDSFVSRAWVMAQSYNQALGSEGSLMLKYCGLICAGLAALLVLVRAATAFATQQKRRLLRRAWLFGWTAWFAFTSWKHGFVRGDSWHAVFFFGFVPVLALGLEIVPDDSTNLLQRARRALTIVCWVVPLGMMQFLFFPTFPKSALQSLACFKNNLSGLLRPAERWRPMLQRLESDRRKAQLPELRQRLGRSVVDVFGCYQAAAIYNELNYRPSPVPQSYAACSASLMNLNEQFYSSTAAPPFVLFELAATDSRFPPLENAYVLRDLLIRYRLIASEKSLLLLQARSQEPLQVVRLQEGTVAPGQVIDLRPYGDTNLWLEINLEPTWHGWLRQQLFHPPIVRLAAWDELKKLLVRKRAPASMMSAGFLASPLLLNTEDVRNLYTARPVTHPAGYSVELLPGEEHFWKPVIRYRLYQINNSLAADGNSPALAYWETSR